MHGTTSGLPAPHGADLTASSNANRCIGRARLFLLLGSEKPLREVFRRFSLLPRTNRQFSVGKGALTSSHLSVFYRRGYPNKKQTVCQGVSAKKRGTSN